MNFLRRRYGAGNSWEGKGESLQGRLLAVDREWPRGALPKATAAHADGLVRVSAAAWEGVPLAIRQSDADPIREISTRHLLPQRGAGDAPLGRSCWGFLTEVSSLPSYGAQSYSLA